MVYMIAVRRKWRAPFYHSYLQKHEVCMGTSEQLKQQSWIPTADCIGNTAQAGEPAATNKLEHQMDIYHPISNDPDLIKSFDRLKVEYQKKQ